MVYMLFQAYFQEAIDSPAGSFQSLHILQK